MAEDERRMVHHPAGNRLGTHLIVGHVGNQFLGVDKREIINRANEIDHGNAPDSELFGA